MRIPYRRACAPKGFSLLELLIVLGVMVGLAAIAWPSLRRPLADSSTLQAARELAEFIADGRSEALAKGQPVFVQFGAGQSKIVFGDWQSIVGLQIADSVANDRDGQGSSPNLSAANSESTPRLSTFLRTWRLPEDIVVERVVFSDLQGYLNATLPQNDEVYGEQVGGGEFGSFPNPPSQEPSDVGWVIDSSTSYMPISASGFASTTVVILFDSAVGSRAALELDGQTGMIRVERLSPAEPGVSRETM